MVGIKETAGNRTLYAKIYFSASYILRGSLSKVRKGKNKKFFAKKQPIYSFKYIDNLLIRIRVCLNHFN